MRLIRRVISMVLNDDVSEYMDKKNKEATTNINEVELDEYSNPDEHYSDADTQLNKLVRRY